MLTFVCSVAFVKQSFSQKLVDAARSTVSDFPSWSIRSFYETRHALPCDQCWSVNQ